jgi:ribonuclease MRP protein subunit SNM1
MTEWGRDNRTASSMAVAFAARQRHLDQASLALLASSPAVSAYLMEQSLADDLENAKAGSRKDRGKVCTACGNILLLGWSCHKVTAKRAGRHPIKSKESSTSGEILVNVVCGKCSSKVTLHKQCRSPCVQGPKPEIAKPRPSTPAKEMETVPTANAGDTKPAPSTATNRKARGKKSSLQSLLAGKRPPATQSAQGGFDLMDFMKT